ncbi:MAG: sulfatase [Planctomycetota bacterium]
MANTPPNFLFLVGEDVGRHHGCYGDDFAHTPHLDRLATEGCLFRNAYTTAPVCSPARSTMISGQDPRKIGSHLHRSKLAKPPRVFTEELRDAGYFVNWANKTDFNYDEEADNFKERLADARTDWRKDLAAGKLPDQPWLFFYNFNMTHESQLWPSDAEANVAKPDPQCDDAELDELPGLEVPPYMPDTRTTRASLVRYYKNLEEQDRQIGHVLEDLERQGLADNTVVIYISDHGRGLIREKRWCYPAGVRMPMIVRAPGLTDPASVRDDLVSWVDIAPTILALAGVDRPENYDGRPLLGPDAEAEPDCVFFGRDRMDSSHDRVRGAADRRYLYLHNDRPDIPYAQCNRYMETSPVTTETRRLSLEGKLRFPDNVWMQLTKPQEELYDLVSDPHGLHNLADRAEYAQTLSTLRDAVADWCERIDDKGRKPERELIEQGLILDDLEGLQERKGEILPELDPDGLFSTRFDADKV